MAEKLTDKVVKALPTPAKGNRITYDADVKGFGVRVTAAGGRAFVLNYRRKGDGLERRWTIGGFPDWTTGAARDEAKRLKRVIDAGGDPVGENRDVRGAPTVNDLCQRFADEYSRASERPRRVITKRRCVCTSDPRSAVTRFPR